MGLRRAEWRQEGLQTGVPSTRHNSYTHPVLLLRLHQPPQPVLCNLRVLAVFVPSWRYHTQ